AEDGIRYDLVTGVQTCALPILALLVLSSLLLASPSPGRGAEWRDVSDARLVNAERDAGNWLMYNRTYAGWRYSPLEQISTANIKIGRASCRERGGDPSGAGSRR